MRIDYLANHPQLIDELAVLHHEQWGHFRPEESLAERRQRLESQCGRGGVPSVVVALEGDGLAGSAMLIAHDMDTRPDLTPWLAGVYVVEAFRGTGVASALVTRIEEEAARVGVERLYLYTPDAMALYAKLGWVAEECCAYRLQQVTIMMKQLG